MLVWKVRWENLVVVVLFCVYIQHHATTQAYLSLHSIHHSSSICDSWIDVVILCAYNDVERCLKSMMCNVLWCITTLNTDQHTINEYAIKLHDTQHTYKYIRACNNSVQRIYTYQSKSKRTQHQCVCKALHSYRFHCGCCKSNCDACAWWMHTGTTEHVRRSKSFELHEESRNTNAVADEIVCSRVKMKKDKQTETNRCNVDGYLACHQHIWQYANASTSSKIDWQLVWIIPAMEAETGVVTLRIDQSWYGCI